MSLTRIEKYSHVMYVTLVLAPCLHPTAMLLLLDSTLLDSTPLLLDSTATLAQALAACLV